MLIGRLILESFSFASNSLKVNKLRTFLSLLGITIGIFAIISVFTVIDSLEGFIRKSMDSLGSNLVYIQKWPWTPEEGESEYPWWKYRNRPILNVEDAYALQRSSNNFQSVTFFYGFNRSVDYNGDRIDNLTVLATTYELLNVWNLKIEKGRYFTQREIHAGAPLTVIGAEIADKLFKGTNPIGKFIKIQGFRLQIIGVYEKSGQDMFGTSMDNYIHISAIKSFYMIDIRNRDIGQTICVKAKDDLSKGQFLSELEGIMRNIRNLKPREENDFAMNEVSLISNQFDKFFVVFNLAGWIIGGFSIIVGGFGIANIMFVSVKERTQIIGIQKSLGAKRWFILLEFIFEAVVLSVLGGVIGLILVFLGTLIVNGISDFNIFLTVDNIVRGLLISSGVGFISGFMPALAAARLNPVEAINSV